MQIMIYIIPNRGRQKRITSGQGYGPVFLTSGTLVITSGKRY